MKTIKLPKCGMFIGSVVYLDRADYLFQHSGKYYTSWVSEDRSPDWYLEKIAADNQGNLVIIWDGGATRTCLRAMADWMDIESLGYVVPTPDWEHKKFLRPCDWDVIKKHSERFGAGFFRLVKKASEMGLYSFGIYAEANPQWVRKINQFKNHFLGYNTGEKFCFDLETEAGENKTDFREPKNEIKGNYDLRIISGNFIKSVRRFIDSKKAAGWKNFLTTSGSFHLDYEVAASGGITIPHVESFGFNNLNFAAALCRGLQKQFALPFWGSYIAHEHYSFLPYKSGLKFKMLDASFLLAYLGGAKLVTLESGNWWQQADHVEDTVMHKTPKIDLGSIRIIDPVKTAPFVKAARKYYPQLGYGSAICARYRKSLSDFYDFVKANGTPAGLPEITLAAIKGDMDLCSQYFSPNIAVAGAHRIAEKNPLWLEGAPERGWNIFRDVFYPLNNGLGKYVNKWFAGTPYGMTDIVSFAGKCNADFLSKNYKALLFTGWNTSSEQQYEILKDYVCRGGTLFISIPHLSMNITRNYISYTVDELVRRGDFRELCGVRVKGRGKQFYWALPVKNNPLCLPYKQFGIVGTHIGDIEICGRPEIIAVEDENFTPLLLLNRYGKGRVFFLNSWAYPGALDRNEGPGAELDSKGFIGEIYKKIALDSRGRVFITDDRRAPGKNCEYISYSFFPSNGNICLMNVDFVRPRKFFLHTRKSIREIPLKPLELRIVSS
jgi:hypothetical protein